MPLPVLTVTTALLTTWLAFASSTAQDDADADADSDDCGELVCLYPSDSDKTAKFAEGDQLSARSRRKEAKRYRKRKSVELSVAVRGSRGSVFVDGRYLAPQGRELKPGKHELEVRDGETVLALGVLTIPRGLERLEVVVHGDRSDAS